MIETERKYLGANRNRLRKTLAQLGAVSEACHFESNTIFDTAQRSLYESGSLLRLRMQEWPHKRHCVVTFKRKLANSVGKVKSREELETEIGDFSAAAAILAGCGFLPVARYEKVREQWHFEPGACFAGLNVDLDSAPFGFVVEIEGHEEMIDRLGDQLGLDKSKISLKTYHELNQEWRERNGLKQSHDLLFEPKQRMRFRKAIGLA